MLRIVSFCLFAFLAVPSSAHAKTYWLDTYEANTRGYIGPMRTQVLDRNDPYVVTARGTFSFLASAEYRGPFCGAVEPAPIYLSPRRRNGPVNADVEFTFADVNRNCSRRNNNPIVPQRFTIAVGSKYRDYRPLGAVLTAPTASHRYRYGLTGKGRRVGFRMAETYGKDNYGRIRIDIRRARASDCQVDFAAFGHADAPSCVSAVSAAR